MLEKSTSDRKTRDDRVDLAGAEFSSFTVEEAADDRILRSSLWVAVGFHALLLMINLPAFHEAVEASPPKKETFHVVPTPRFERPKVPRTPIPPKRVKRIPVPDPTPHEIEPIRHDEPVPEVDLPEPDIDFKIPEAPPMPEPEGPIIIGGDVQKPEKIHTVQPLYTNTARIARLQGQVIVQAIIDKQGDVTDVKVLKGLRLGLSEEAVKAVEQWKFKPATLRGKPVAVYFNLTVRFQLS